MTAVAVEHPSRSSRARPLVALAWAVSLVTVTTSLVLALPWSEYPDLGLVSSVIPLVLVFLLTGSMITLRQPTNAVGPVLLLVGSLFAFLMLTGGTTKKVSENDVRMWVTLVSSGMWAPPIFTLLGVIPLIFPNGSLPSRRWRIVVWLSVTGSALTVLSSPFDPEVLKPLDNPIGNQAVYEGVPGAPIGFIAIIAALVGMVRRFRRARGTERDQMKIFVTGVVVAVFAMVLNGVLIQIIGENDTPAVIEAGLLILSAAVFSITIGVAILRHKLFDINLVISKALVYSAFVAVLTGMYFLFIVLIGGLVVGTDDGNPVFPVAATAAAALAFQPLRTRAQRLANRIVYGKRASPYEVLSNLSEQLRETYASEDVLSRMARSMAEGTGATEARVWIRSGDIMVSAASWPPDLPVLETAAIDATLTVPVAHAGEMLGALSITKPPNDPLTTTEERLVTDLGAQAGLVLRNASLTQQLLARLEELKASRQRLVKAQDEERRRLERDLHDGAQQMLVALKVNLGLAARIAQDEQLRAMITQAVADTGEALETVRDLARGIYPPLLASEGLVAALKAQASKATVPVQIEAAGLERYPQEMEAAVYFCILEALQNVQKYADASQVVVEVGADEGMLRFSVRDDGRGFDPETVTRGSGTQNMADRLGALDGTLELLSTPGEGTTVLGRVPLAVPTRD